jgi:CubicO group peptidase (beta-lactamase class C family)
MKIYPSLFVGILIILYALSVRAEDSARRKADSVSVLIKNYLDTGDYNALYSLTGKTFRSRVKADVFDRVARTEFAPLGKIYNLIFEQFVNNAAWYKAVFASQVLKLIIVLNSNDKIDFFRLKKGKDNYVSPTSNPLFTPIDSLVDGVGRRFMMQAQAIGLSIGIIHEGQLYFYGYGETEKNNKTVPQPTTVYEIASITKTFTATLLAMAIAEGRAKLNDPVNKYLPDFIPPIEFNGKSVTLLHLANHTGGIPFMPDNFDSSLVKTPRSTMMYGTNELFDFLKQLHLTYEPGTIFRYSNAVYAILSVILQHIYNASYDQLLHRYITKPANMSDTKTFIAEAKSFAFAYDKDGNLTNSWNHRPVLIGHGGIASSARDMLQFAAWQFNATSKNLKNAIALCRDTTFQNNDIVMGLGWRYIQPGPTPLLYHDGGTVGYTSYFALDPARKLAVILLSNSNITLAQDGDFLISKLQAK